MSEKKGSAPERILLVDDNLTNLQVLYIALEQEGYELLIAQSGEEAITTAKEAQPQMILLDINMPGMDGYETCRRLKADATTRDCVVIFLSARGHVDDKVRGLDLGAVDYIGKPFQFEEVVARVRKHLETNRQHQDLRASNEQLREELEGGFRDFSQEELRALVSAGESDGVEFKSTVRRNLHTDKPDKRIENACLKTVAAYLNSAGGLLLVGVDDEGNALGLEKDGFASEDKLLLHWHGLLKETLGPESLRWVRTRIVDLDDRRVLLVQCLRATGPVFLRRDNEESFFVRTGNRTDSLKPSELLAYLEQRKQEGD